MPGTFLEKSLQDLWEHRLKFDYQTWKDWNLLEVKLFIFQSDVPADEETDFGQLFKYIVEVLFRTAYL
jgi:hypothetical protein